LFGGYRSDNYEAVLDLHLKSLLICSRIICENPQRETLFIPKKTYARPSWLEDDVA
jgi:hypothetical protein